MCPQIIFNPELHEYRADGVLWPSVTQVMPKQEGLKFVTEEHKEACRQEGENNHAAAESFFRDGETHGIAYLEGLKEFVKDHPFLGKFIGAEVVLWSKHRYAGTADLIFENAIVDIKRTIGNKKIHALQLAGYCFAAVERGLIKDTRVHIILTIDDDGKYHAVNVWNELSTVMFLSCVKRWWTHASEQVDKIDYVINQYLKTA